MITLLRQVPFLVIFGQILVSKGLPTLDSSYMDEEELNFDNSSFALNSALSCPVGQVLNRCGSGCELSCETLHKEWTNCSEECHGPPTCVCPEPLIRHPSGACIEHHTKCPPSTLTSCSANETLEICGHRCESSCDQLRWQKTCVPNCSAFLKCECRSSFHRRSTDGYCVLAEDCGHPALPSSGKPQPNLVEWLHEHVPTKAVDRKTKNSQETDKQTKTENDFV